MELISDVVFRIVDGPASGLYRIVIVDPPLAAVAAARLDPEEHGCSIMSGRRKQASTKNARKKPPKRLVTQLRWFQLDALYRMRAAGALLVAEIKIPARNYRTDDNAHAELFGEHTRIMAPLLDPTQRHELVLVHHGWSGFVKNAQASHGCSRSLVYKLISRLCRYGFQPRSLLPDYAFCGAPRVPRPIDIAEDREQRKKAGRKTNAERGATHAGIPTPAHVQPGMSTDWRIRVLAADLKISSPKPPMPQRITQIHASAFVTTYEEKDGSFVGKLGPKGTYPNDAQIRHLLRSTNDRLERLLEATTRAHYERALKGMKGRSWKNVAGPGHTWAIDSTVGDIILRSSVNRAWILGRPVVYVIVDVWSTAVVGFYVCMSGPSWAMARVALFNACAPAELLGDLWGFRGVPYLNPVPTLAANLLCDRGEYLSRAASEDSLAMLLTMSYTPPRRPDYKGIVEVLHRITKNKTYFLVPGAIDARRKEYELRRVQPWKSALTIQEFVHYLFILFREYNLTSDRSHRLDAHMVAANVHPSPAGLWNWGHRSGIGFGRHVVLDDLIRSLLQPVDAKVTREGVMFGGRLYSSALIGQQQWSALARNFGSWPIEALAYPGSVSRLWTPSHTGDGLLQLELSDESSASRELTVEEAMDAFAVQSLKNAELAHDKADKRTTTALQIRKLVAAAIDRTAAADQAYSGPDATPGEARQIEAATRLMHKVPQRSEPPRSETESEAEDRYLETMARLLQYSNEVS